MSDAAHNHLSPVRTDELFIEVIRTELDAAAEVRQFALNVMERARRVEVVLDRMEAEILELLTTGSLVPALLTVRIRQEVERTFDPPA